MSRNLKATFTITGELDLTIHADEHELPKGDKGNRKALFNLLDRRLKAKGVEAFNIALTYKARELENDDYDEN